MFLFLFFSFGHILIFILILYLLVQEGKEYTIPSAFRHCQQHFLWTRRIITLHKNAIMICSSNMSLKHSSIYAMHMPWTSRHSRPRHAVLSICSQLKEEYEFLPVDGEDLIFDSWNSLAGRTSLWFTPNIPNVMYCISFDKTSSAILCLTHCQFADLRESVIKILYQPFCRSEGGGGGEQNTHKKKSLYEWGSNYSGDRNEKHIFSLSNRGERSNSRVNGHWILAKCVVFSHYCS